MCGLLFAGHYCSLLLLAVGSLMLLLLCAAVSAEVAAGSVPDSGSASAGSVTAGGHFWVMLVL